MQITLPNDLSVRLHQLAEQHRQPFKQYLADHLRLTLDDDPSQLPLAEQAELQALRRLSTDALRTIAAEQMATSVKERMAQLMEKICCARAAFAASTISNRRRIQWREPQRLCQYNGSASRRCYRCDRSVIAGAPTTVWRRFGI